MSSATDYLSRSVAEMEAILSRFDERVDEALSAAPASKSWVEEALRRNGNGRCPVWLRRLSCDIVLRYGDALADLFCRYPDDFSRVVPYDIWTGYQSPDKRPRINSVEIATRDARWQDEWGTSWGHAFGGVGATPTDYPLKDWSQLDEYLATALPDPRAPGRFSDAATWLSRFGQSRYCCGTIHLALFERFHSLRGMENVFTDFYDHEAETRRLLDALSGYVLELIRQWGELGADAIMLTDDWGSQTALMISPAMWRSFFRPHYERLFTEAHQLGLAVIFHSCGNVMELVDDLIEVGIDVLDPVQPGAMDIDELARRFGGRVSFCGGIDLQQLLTSGSPQQVRDGVRCLIGTLGRPFGGGYVVSPANVLVPDIPFENLEALFEAAHAD